MFIDKFAIFKKIGGYNETFNRQDGHYLWYSILFKKFNILHINKPLFFYRKHKKNLSKNKKKILYNRLKIINYFLKKYHYVQELTHQKKLTKKKLKGCIKVNYYKILKKKLQIKKLLFAS